MTLKCDAVFEGGGVKGTGFAGAISALERAGYEFINVVGTSAGAIAASLIAAGYTGEEIEWELKAVDYSWFRQDGTLSRLGLAGKTLNLALHFGLHKADAFERWLAGLLQRKGKRTFGDILTGFTEDKYKYKLQAVASDISDRAMLVLPGGLKAFGVDPDSFEIAAAVRMSMSIPAYYEPYRLKDTKGADHYIVDGGLLSNYPIWLLDDGTSNPMWPTFGFRFVGEERGTSSAPPINNVSDYSKAVVSTLIEAHDNRHISESKGDFQRTIIIPSTINTKNGVENIKTTDFNITAWEKEKLLQSGRHAAERFLNGWSFEEWKKKYRR